MKICNILGLRREIQLKSCLKELWAREGWNQTELAKRAKISHQTVSFIEREEYMPSLLIAIQMTYGIVVRNR